MLTRDLIAPRNADWTIPQNWERFMPAEHAVWDTLFARQSAALQGRAVREFFQGLDVLRLSRPGIPDFDELNERLFARTGWTIVSVPGLVPNEVFFAHLSRRRFPAGNFIRAADSLDYIEQPDVFHDVFGHVPLLAQPAVADFMQAMGAAGLAAMKAGALHRLARLYWYSVEFGLALEDGAPRIYGAGLLSSFGESRFALDSPEPRRRLFDLRRVLRTRYRSDAFQQGYFVIPGFDALLRLLEDNDLDELYGELDEEPDLNP
ncbi:phenylalanine 4-monooxygenase [Sphingosinicella sp.]|uniref:phenylalanine 4-monooxygenase n=1 Tax=Sphingosinicella sp. TaxID=1917971 RepID=UPI00403777E7